MPVIVIGSSGRCLQVEPLKGFGFCSVPDLLKDQTAGNIVYLTTADQGATFVNRASWKCRKSSAACRPDISAATRELFFAGEPGHRTLRQNCSSSGTSTLGDQVESARQETRSVQHHQFGGGQASCAAQSLKIPKSKTNAYTKLRPSEAPPPARWEVIKNSGLTDKNPDVRFAASACLPAIIGVSEAVSYYTRYPTEQELL